MKRTLKRAAVVVMLAALASGAGATLAAQEQAGKAAPAKSQRRGFWRLFGRGQAAPADAAAKPAVAAPAPAPAETAAPAATPAGKESYVIVTDDMLAISVWKEPQVSRVVPVRPDGKISVPLAGELQASGLTPTELQANIAEALKKYVAEPVVTVIVEKATRARFNILGEIQRPGSYELANALTVLDAISMAGGFRDFAKTKSIYILRRTDGGAPERLSFNYNEVKNGRNFTQNIKLQAGDTVVVP